MKFKELVGKEEALMMFLDFVYKEEDTTLIFNRGSADGANGS